MSRRVRTCCGSCRTGSSAASSPSTVHVALKILWRQCSLFACANIISSTSVGLRPSAVKRRAQVVDLVRRQRKTLRPWFACSSAARPPPSTSIGHERPAASPVRTTSPRRPVRNSTVSTMRSWSAARRCTVAGFGKHAGRHVDEVRDRRARRAAPRPGRHCGRCRSPCWTRATGCQVAARPESSSPRSSTGARRGPYSSRRSSTSRSPGIECAVDVGEVHEPCFDRADAGGLAAERGEQALETKGREAPRRPAVSACGVSRQRLRGRTFAMVLTKTCPARLTGPVTPRLSPRV